MGGVSVQQLRKASTKYSEHKSLGPDAVESSFLNALPDQVLVFLVGMFRIVGCRGAWPAFLRQVYMALLPKPDGGVRTVGKTCMLYRMWARMRFPVTRAWERQRMPDWDKAKAKSSAGDAGYARALLAEAAVNNGQHVACQLWDFKQFFDRMSTSMLVSCAVAQQFRMQDFRLAVQVHVGPR